MLNKNIKAFVIHVFSHSLESIYPNKEAQIASLLMEKITILDKYLDFTDVFSEQHTLVLSDQTKLN